MNQHLERVDGLAPLLQYPVLRLIELCEQNLGRKLLVVRGWSSVQDQLLKYQRGRTYDPASGIWAVTDPGQVVTQARPGASAHNVVTKGTGAPAALAVDLIPLDNAGQPDWEVEMHWWEQLYELAWKVGLDPLGDPTGAYLAYDKGHFEEPGWKGKLDGLQLVQPSSVVHV